ncbi:hypothetical protein [Leclercia sp. M50]|uniref:hypothetical protein n=1 Tax=Leclercia sp. M50 TaxID=3081258 RepID=UPI00301AD1CF
MPININLLKNLRQALLSALTLSIEHDEEYDQIEKITDVLRQVELTTLLHEQDVYAIAGMQGAGKTTLAKEILGIDDDWLDANPGRGEQMPLFIEQVDDSSGHYPEIRYICLNMDTKTIEERDGNGSEELKSLLRDWNSIRRYEQNGYKLLYPILRISKQHSFINEQITWALLPGYELTTSKNHRWQEMMRHVLVNARGVIFVTDQSLLANDSKSGVLEDLQENFSERGPVVVVTKTEMLNEEEIKELKNSATARFFPKTSMTAESVVATGLGNREAWIKDLEITVSKHLTSSAASDAMALDKIMGLIREDVTDIITGLRMLADTQQDEQTFIDELLEKFDKSTASYEHALRRALKVHTKKHYDNALKKCEENYREEEEGWKNNVEQLGQRILLRGIDIDRKRRNRVLDAWNNCYEQKEIYDHNFNALTEVNTQKLRSKGLLPKETPALAIETVAGKMGYQCQGDENPPFDTDEAKELMKDISCLLYKPASMDAIPDFKALTTVLEILPALVLERTRFTLVTRHDTLCSTQLAEEIQPKQIFDTLFSSSEQYHPIKTAMVALLGADASDGTLDGKHTSDSGGGLTPLALVGKAALVASLAYGLYQLTGIIRDSDKAQIYYIRRLMDELALYNEQAIIDNFQMLMEYLRLHIENNLKQIYGAKDTLSSRSGLLLAVKRLSAVQKEAKLYESHFRQILA